jgi:hypothetical protein
VFVNTNSKFSAPDHPRLFQELRLLIDILAFTPYAANSYPKACANYRFPLALSHEFISKILPADPHPEARMKRISALPGRLFAAPTDFFPAI